MAINNQLLLSPEEIDAVGSSSSKPDYGLMVDSSAPTSQLLLSPEEIDKASSSYPSNYDLGVTGNYQLGSKLLIDPDAVNGYSLPAMTRENNQSIIGGMSSAFSRGLQRSVTGQLLGAGEQTEETSGFLNYLAEFGGILAGDMPAFKGGAAVGAVIGGTIGSAVPILGTALGASLGAAFFGMAAPIAIKSGFNEYREFRKKGGEGSFEEFIKGVGNWALETGKAGALGLATANLSRFLPILKKVPAFEKILRTNLGSKLTTRGVELVGLTTAQSLIDGQLPTKAQWRDNALTIAYMDVAGAMGIPIRAYTPEYVKSAPGKLRKQIMKRLPKAISAPIERFSTKAQEIKTKVENKEYRDFLKEHVGERRAKIMGDQMDIKLQTKKKNAEGKFVDRWTPEIMEDMIYARQKTGNPRIKGDTIEKVNARIPKDGHVFLKDFVGPFFENIRKEMNADERLQHVDFKQDYLPGLYKGDTSKIKLPKNFSLYDVFANPKTFSNLAEAAKEAGLIPKFNDITQFMASYADTTTKLIAKSKLVGQINKMNKDGDLIIRSNDKRYNEVERSGKYTPMQDEYLRRVRTVEDTVGEEIKTEMRFEEIKDSRPGAEILKKLKLRAGEDVYRVSKVPKLEKKVTWKLTEKPALVLNEFADAFQGVFAKDAPVKEHPAWGKLDKAANVIKSFRTAASGFHIVSLLESAFGVFGVKALNVPAILKTGREFQLNKEKMVDYARSGGVTGNPVDFGKGMSVIDSGLDFIGSKTGKFGAKAANKVKKGLNWVFDSLHTNLKLATYDKMVNEQVTAFGLDGKGATKLKREIAEFTNNIYGGQDWETAKFFNDPKVLRRLRRTLAFSDWTVSAIKQAGGGLKKGSAGHRSRKYLTKYLTAAAITQASLKYLFGGIEQTDKENKSVKGIRWSRKKAAEEFFKGDPSKWYQFPLPDAEVKIGPTSINLGRDTNNKKMYGHFGKQFLEVLGYGTKPVQTIFSKSNPIFQLAYQQLIGATPSEDGSFPVRGKYDKGKFKAWDATEPYTVGRAASRGAALVQGVSPFSVSTATSRGVGPYLGSAFGSYPISKGMSLYKSKKYIKDALLGKDYGELARIRRVLLNNGYKDKSIKATISKIKKSIR